jgi:hypothetical protein
MALHGFIPYARIMIPTSPSSLESALTIFRPLYCLTTPFSLLTLLAPVLDMTTPGILSYDPPVARQMQSQIASIPYTVAKGLISRLDAILISNTEAAFAFRTPRFQLDCSLLSYLQEPGDGITPALVAISFLEELTDGIEDVSTTTALVISYV